MKLVQIAALICLAVCGCGRSAKSPKVQVLPVKGTVTLDGKPLSGANVVFMTADPPAAFVGMTQEDGTFQLQGAEGRAANCQGPCQVTISRLAKSDGSPLAPGEMPALVGAVEQLPSKYSQFGETTLSANVGAEGGTFDFPLTSQ